MRTRRTTVAAGRCDDDPRILMLVPHEPDEDPRVTRVMEMCQRLAKTEVYGWSTRQAQRPPKQYDGRVSVELVNFMAYQHRPELVRATRDIYPYHLPAALLWLVKVLRPVPPFSWIGPTLHRRAAQGAHRPPPATTGGARQVGWYNAAVDFARAWYDEPQRVDEFRAQLEWWNWIVQSLYVRGRAMSVAPRFILATDVYGLIAGVRLKRLFGCPLIYDSHELWPEGRPGSAWWEVETLAFLERRAIRDADKVIVVSPQIKTYESKLFDLKDVTVVVNAEPLRYFGRRSYDRPAAADGRLRFVFQGGVAPGRGVERLLQTWAKIAPRQAVLIVRARDNSFLAELRERHAPEVRRGSVEFAPPVPEERVIETASEGDVGVIPYPGPNLNHVFACPNKLSQYMQAGVAILHHADMQYVGEMVSRFGCGRAFDPADADGLAAIIDALAADREGLQAMKRNAWEAARTHFNWETLSADYWRVLEQTWEATAR